MNDRAPGSSWDSPIWYGEWRIYRSSIGYPAPDFEYCHDDYDGAEDAGDGRCGAGASPDDCIAQINERVLEQQECPKCGLEAKSLLHRFCTHKICPVRAALGRGVQSATNDTAQGAVGPAINAADLRPKYWRPEPPTTAWLIEWPADDNMPVRWWHPVTGWMLDANKACWFIRREDAQSLIASSVFVAGLRPGPDDVDGRCGLAGAA